MGVENPVKSFFFSEDSAENPVQSCVMLLLRAFQYFYGCIEFALGIHELNYHGTEGVVVSCKEDESRQD